MKNPPEPIFTRLELICLGPYRLLFPLGILCGILGVGHWLLWSIGWLPESNSYFHATIQVEGFLGCFVVGFLMTALPRFLGTGIAKGYEVALAVSAVVTFIVCELMKRWAFAQSAFLALILCTVIFAARRFPNRTKNPPGSFLLVAFGLLQAVLGPSLMLVSRFGQGSLNLMEIGRQMLQIGFLLCLVLGIAGYLAPFLMGYASDPSCDPGVTPLRGTGPLAIFFHTLTGSLILSSFFLEIHHARFAAGLRAFIVLFHLNAFARIYRSVQKKAAYVYFFWIACWMVPTGLSAVFLRPDLRLAGLHLIFIGGFSLMIFSFALMVVLSHGAEAALLNGRLIPLKVVGVSVLSAMVMRYLADLDAWHYKMWIHSASGMWVVAAGFWLIYVFPKLWRQPVASKYPLA